MEQLPRSLSNATAYLPSPEDLLMAVPRLLQRAGSFAEHMDVIFGKMRSGGSVIAQPTVSNATNATIITGTSKFVQESAAAAAAAAASAAMTGQDVDLSPFQALKNVGSFFTYMTSKWAIATFAVAILLNRTQFYASSRVPLNLDRWYIRLAIYILPMTMFVYQVQSMLQAIHCQTSPMWSSLQYGATGKELDTDFAGEGQLLWRISSAILFWEDTEGSCRAVDMLPSDLYSPRPTGSLSLLWPLFLSMGLSQFVETLSCALQGRTPGVETGMTLFEHSLAFAEAEAVVTKPFSFDSTRFWKPQTLFTLDGESHRISRLDVIQFANVPPEVLLISLISSLSHLSSNFLAIIGLRSRLRLVTTGIWGVAYISAFLWSFVRFASMAADPGPQPGILRFPTVCIVGFIPHLLIIIGIAACGLIYSLAFALTVSFPPPGQADNISWRERFELAYRNLHANIHLSAITPLRINWQEDFYTAILKIGFTVLTAASEAVYLNEGTRINVSSMTWVEKKRLQEILARRRLARQSIDIIPVELRGDSMADGVEVVDSVNHSLLPQDPASGYARERKSRGVAGTSDAARAVGRDNGVGLQQRRGRWTLTYQYLRGISRLLLTIHAKTVLYLLRKLRITYSPRWLAGFAGPQVSSKNRAGGSGTIILRPRGSAEPWLVVDEKTKLRPRRNMDVEETIRQSLRNRGYYEQYEQQVVEDNISTSLYEWWKSGGKWGEIDTSGDFIAPDADDDTTSVISFATTEEQDEWSDLEDGQRTPTQESPYPQSRDTTPIPDNLVDLSHLSRLLDPKTQEEHEEARLLSRHLQNDGVLTRSQYRKALDRDQARVLTSSKLPVTGFTASTQMTPEEEESVLEEFILNKRGAATTSSVTNNASSWDSGAEGMGSEGPQCVVCQLSPRTVLVWPCGCLSLCDDCRVGLASKNYTTCVCCRTNVVAYSRLYVP